jgi:hypothetical protein
MTNSTIAAAAENFDRDVVACLDKIACERAAGVGLPALPEAVVGRYPAAPDGPRLPPPTIAVDVPELWRIAEAAGDMAERDTWWPAWA